MRSDGVIMKIQSVNKIRLKKCVENILRNPGAMLHQILEIAVVIDCGLERREAAETVRELAFALKSFGETFRNVRVNVIWWKSETERVQEIKPLAALQMSGFVAESNFFDEENEVSQEKQTEGPSAVAGEKQTEGPSDMTGEGQSKSLDGLAEYMRKFQARSKIVFLITSQGPLFVQDREQVRKHMTPMLHRKWLVLHGECIQRLSIAGELQTVP